MCSQQIPKMNREINLSDFKDLLNNLCVLSETNKEQIISIFNEVSNGDGVLNADEWNTFVMKIDKDKDSILSTKELNNAFISSGLKEVSIQNKMNIIKENVINFCNLILKILQETSEKEIDGLRCLLDRSNQTEVSDTTVFYAGINNVRSQKFNYGDENSTFQDNWLQEDKYGSTTWEEFEENLKKDGIEVDYEIGKAILKRAKKLIKEDNPYVITDKKGNQTTLCASHVRDTLMKVIDNRTKKERNLLESDTKTHRQAYQFASQLALNPNFRELPHNIVANPNFDLSTLPSGCIVVCDAGYKGGNAHNSGHIYIQSKDEAKGYGANGYNVYDGDGKIKEHQATHIRVFVPIKPTDTVG